ncbi:DUF1700 domain-containing protein [Treponema brennaborense]|uniref:DUF1700 domain-containing protein n=1 Tax=Treponema brennaborense (strain DSM 12168 / CIP 105900 / DD5/3) TaxID=906968 RepID=F4LJT2_TREBD|nr:DUF1700 domain-containing protein [Treponema brennaborense]AEE17462.1 protein of unknown function DUF1700 [Treponema brennaborense DSM 12168]
MNKTEYIAALRTEIQALPETEREEAILYYTEYFDDAGAENEAAVIAELGTPEELGKYILTKFSCVPETVKASAKKKAESALNAAGKTEKASSGAKILLIILLVVITFPIWIPVVSTVFGIAFGLLIAAIAIVCSLFIAAIAVLIGGLAALIFGLAAMFTAPVSGILLAGLGLMLAGAGLICTVFGIWICTKCIPVIIRGFVKLCKMPFSRRKENDNV